MTKEEKELQRLIREQKADMGSRHTKIQYKGRNNKYLQPNYKFGDSEELEIALEDYKLRTQDGKDKVESNE